MDKSESLTYRALACKEVVSFSKEKFEFAMFDLIILKSSQCTQEKFDSNRLDSSILHNIIFDDLKLTFFPLQDINFIQYNSVLLKKVLLIEQFNKNDLFKFEKSNFALSKISNLNDTHSDFVLIKFQ